MPWTRKLNNNGTVGMVSVKKTLKLKQMKKNSTMAERSFFFCPS